MEKGDLLAMPVALGVGALLCLPIVAEGMKAVVHEHGQHHGVHDHNVEGSSSATAQALVQYEMWCWSQSAKPGDGIAFQSTRKS